MSTANAIHAVDETAAAGRVVDAFLEAKLQAPPVRADWVARSRLLDRLDLALTRPLTLIAAPAGYGKTTLAAQWTASDRSPTTAWVSLDSGDNDPGRLWTHIASALERAGCTLSPDLFAIMGANNAEVLAGLLPTLINALAALPEDIVVILDDFHLVDEPACHEQVAFLLEHLPSQAHLVILTRADPSIRLGRLRVTGKLSEIRADDLSFTRLEATSLLSHEQVQLTSDSVGDLMQRTEGWPAGLYLAALSLTGRDDPDGFVRAFTGDHRFIGDYLTEEVFSRHTESERRFITTMSIFDRFSAQLGDYVAQTTGSSGLLHDFERRNLFLVPLDNERHWFRFHHLFAAVARSELEAEAPERVAHLHARAGEWFRGNGYIDEAVKHFMAGGRSSDAAHLIQANWFHYVDLGRAATVVGWLEALGTPTVVSDPAAAVTAAWMSALSGNREAYNQLVQALEQFADYGPLPDGTRSVESAIALLQGIFGFGGVQEMLHAGRRAVELETDGRSPFFSVAHAAFGHASYVVGDLDRAATNLFVAIHSDAAPSVIRQLSMSVLSFVEAERGKQQASLDYAERAMDIVAANGLEVLPQSSMAFTALGAARAASGKTSDGWATLEHGLMLRRKNAALSPWPTVHQCLMMAGVAIDVGQPVVAQSLLDEAAQLMSPFDEDMDAMRSRLASVQTRLRERQTRDSASEPLTSRELDILELLQSSLSSSEIARELFVSVNTVKTHTRAIYRKLGATSRDEAVRIAREKVLI